MEKGKTHRYDVSTSKEGGPKYLRVREGVTPGGRPYKTVRSEDGNNLSKATTVNSDRSDRPHQAKFTDHGKVTKYRVNESPYNSYHKKIKKGYVSKKK